MAKKSGKDNKKKQISDSINNLLDTHIDWTKLTAKDLDKVVDLVNHMDEIAMRVAKRRMKDWARGKAESLIDNGIEMLLDR
jgi:hypothetical protein